MSTSATRNILYFQRRFQMSVNSYYHNITLENSGKCATQDLNKLNSNLTVYKTGRVTGLKRVYKDRNVFT